MAGISDGAVWYAAADDRLACTRMDSAGSERNRVVQVPVTSHRKQSTGSRALTVLHFARVSFTSWSTEEDVHTRNTAHTVWDVYRS